MIAQTARSNGAQQLIPPRLWIIATALLIARYALLLLSVNRHLAPTGDEPNYVELADNLLAGHGYTAHGIPWAFKPPGWPMVLAMIRWIAGPSRLAVVFAQGLFDTGTILLCGWTALALTRSRTAGVIAFMLALLWPPFFRESRFMQTEPLFTVAITAALALFVRFARSPSLGLAFALGLVTGVASLVRPTGLAPVVAMVLVWLAPRWRRLTPELPRLFAMGLGVVLVLAPWTLRNARVFHAFLPVSTGAGEQFLQGSLNETDGRWNAVIVGKVNDSVIADETKRLGHPPNAVEMDHAALMQGLANYRNDPAGSALRYVKRVWRLCLLPVASGDRPLLRVAFFVALLTVYALAIPAGIEGLRHPNGPGFAAGAVLVALLINVLAMSLLYTNSRYFEPMRPFLFVLVADTLATFALARGRIETPGAPRIA